MNTEKCEFCDGVIGLSVRRIPFHYKKETMYVDHVPVRVCSDCGAVYFEAEVYKKLEQIAKSKERIRTHITFPLADYRADPAKVSR